MQSNSLQTYKQTPDLALHCGHGFGKVILFGEHFVVLGMPAIVTALPQITTADVTAYPTTTPTIIDNRPTVSTFRQNKHEKYQAMLHTILDSLQLKPAAVTLAGNLTVTSGGIGASAAAAVAITRALNNFFCLGLTARQQQIIAHEGEKAIHGSPSGIDTTAAAVGGLFMFQKTDTGFVHQPCVIHHNLHLVLIDTGISPDTATAIQSIKKFKYEDPTTINILCQEYEKLLNQATQAITNDNVHKLGQLMTQNHALLKKLGASNSINNDIVRKALQYGACGAKVTGTGNGGLVVALAPTKAAQLIIATKFACNGYTVFTQSIGPGSQPISQKQHPKDQLQQKTTKGANRSKQ